MKPAETRFEVTAEGHRHAARTRRLNPQAETRVAVTHLGRATAAPVIPGLAFDPFGLPMGEEWDAYIRSIQADQK